MDRLWWNLAWRVLLCLELIPKLRHYLTQTLYDPKNIWLRHCFKIGPTSKWKPSLLGRFLAARYKRNFLCFGQLEVNSYTLAWVKHILWWLKTSLSFTYQRPFMIDFLYLAALSASSHVGLPLLCHPSRIESWLIALPCRLYRVKWWLIACTLPPLPRPVMIECLQLADLTKSSHDWMPAPCRLYCIQSWWVVCTLPPFPHRIMIDCFTLPPLPRQVMINCLHLTALTTSSHDWLPAPCHFYRDPIEPTL